MIDPFQLITAPSLAGWITIFAGWITIFCWLNHHFCRLNHHFCWSTAQCILSISSFCWSAKICGFNHDKNPSDFKRYFCVLCAKHGSILDPPIQLDLNFKNRSDFAAPLAKKNWPIPIVLNDFAHQKWAPAGTLLGGVAPRVCQVPSCCRCTTAAVPSNGRHWKRENDDKPWNLSVPHWQTCGSSGVIKRGLRSPHWVRWFSQRTKPPSFSWGISLQTTFDPDGIFFNDVQRVYQTVGWFWKVDWNHISEMQKKIPTHSYGLWNMLLAVPFTLHCQDHLFEGCWRSWCQWALYVMTMDDPPPAVPTIAASHWGKAGRQFLG